MSVKKFTGFQVVRDNSVVTTNFSGLVVTTLENLFITIRGEQGQLIPATITVIAGGDISGEYTSNPLNLAVINSANLTIQVKAENHADAQQSLSHPGEGQNRRVEFNLAEQYVLIIN